MDLVCPHCGNAALYVVYEERRYHRYQVLGVAKGELVEDEECPSSSNEATYLAEHVAPEIGTNFEQRGERLVRCSSCEETFAWPSLDSQSPRPHVVRLGPS